MSTSAGQTEQPPASSSIAGARHSPQRDLPILLAIVAGALLLRILFLNKSLWLDEGVAVANAWAGGLSLQVWRPWFRELWNAEFNMVFYFALLRLWLRAGSGEAFIRLLSVIPALATIPVVYGLGKRLLGASAAMIAALLLAVHGAHVLYSQEARGYTLLVLLSALSTYFFVAAIETRSRKYWTFYVVASVLAIYTHLFGGLVLVAHWASLWWAPRRSIPWRRLLLASLAIAVAAVPALLFVLTNKGQQVNWIPKPGPAQLVNVFSEFAGNPLVLPIYIALWIFGCRSFSKMRSAEESFDQGWRAALILGWMLVPVAMATIISFKRPMLVPRYLLISVPAAVLLASQGALQVSPRNRRIAIWAAVVLSLAFIGFRYTRPKEDWRNASRYVLANAEKGDAVVVVPWWAEQPFAYYAMRWPGAKPQDLRSASLLQRTTPDMARSPQRVWLIVYARPQGLADPETRVIEDALTTRYHVAEQHNFYLVQVRLYSLLN